MWSLPFVPITAHHTDEGRRSDIGTMLPLGQWVIILLASSLRFAMVSGDAVSLALWCGCFDFALRSRVL
jgi:hypothetical protein